MRDTTPDVFLTRELLCWVRDEWPARDEFVARFGEHCFHLLRKSAVIVPEGERLRLNRQHLSPDGTRFVWGIKLIHLNDDSVDVVRWGPDGPPVYSEHP